MANITAQMVKDLRESTGLPMMECKQALTENNGDLEAATEWLRKKHKGKMADRAGRETGEGRIGVYIDDAGKIGALVELRTETAPVAANELFINLANTMARKVAGGSEAKPAPDSIRNDPEIDALFTDTYGKLRETMNLVRCQRVTGGHLAAYIHHDGKTGVLLALDAAPKEASVAADLCMHTAFAKPLAIDRGSIPEEEVEKARALAREVALEEGKPEQIVDKIVAGQGQQLLRGEGPDGAAPRPHRRLRQAEGGRGAQGSRRERRDRYGRNGHWSLDR